MRSENEEVSNLRSGVVGAMREKGEGEKDEQRWEKGRCKSERMQVNMKTGQNMRGRKTRVWSMVVLGAPYTHLYTLRVEDEVCCDLWGTTEERYKLLGASA